MSKWLCNEKGMVERDTWLSILLFGFLREDVARWHVGWKVRNVNCFWVAGAGSKCLSICQEC